MKKQSIHKWKFICIFIVGLLANSAQAQEPSAIVDFESTTQGMLTPRMTTAERLALPGINAPATGLLVYDTETKTFWFWDHMRWNEIVGGSSSSDGGLQTVNGTISYNLPDVVDTITLTGGGIIATDFNIIVCLNVTYPFIEDLSISLTAPDGMTTIDLMSHIGGYGQNLIGTCFSNKATTNITSVSSNDAPFTGLFLPEGSFDVLIGQPIAGDWILRIDDGHPLDDGVFNNWSINIGFGEPVIANILTDGDSDTKIEVEQTLDEDVMHFVVDGQEAMTINIAGQVGIGTTVPLQKLDVKGNAIFGLRNGIGDASIAVENYHSGAAPNIARLRLVGSSGGSCGTTGTIDLKRDPDGPSSSSASQMSFMVRDQNCGGLSERMTINYNGHVGIGASNPQAKLDIRDASSAEMRLSLSNTNWAKFRYNSTEGLRIESKNEGIEFRDIGLFGKDIKFSTGAGTTPERMRIGANGNVGIGMIPNSNKLAVNGEASKSTAGDWVANSDARLKKEINRLESESTLNKMLQLKGITYQWNDDKTGYDRPQGNMYGFTAQNIQEVFPELVSEDEKGYLQTAYGTYDAMYVESLRALNHKIENLESENKLLKNENDLLNERMDRMELLLNLIKN